MPSSAHPERSHRRPQAPPPATTASARSHAIGIDAFIAAARTPAPAMARLAASTSQRSRGARDPSKPRQGPKPRTPPGNSEDVDQDTAPEEARPAGGHETAWNAPFHGILKRGRWTPTTGPPELAARLRGDGRCRTLRNQRDHGHFGPLLTTTPRPAQRPMRAPLPTPPFAPETQAHDSGPRRPEAPAHRTLRTRSTPATRRPTDPRPRAAQLSGDAFEYHLLASKTRRIIAARRQHVRLLRRPQDHIRAGWADRAGGVDDLRQHYRP